ncbi:MAG: DUF2272 domain-containing protein [Pseudomonadales bacterium]|nr:DUF2272 domain-containing protein [Pseudomonadales bacterium]
MHRITPLLATSLLFFSSLTVGQTLFSERLPSSILNVSPPSTRVAGEPGDMFYTERSCSSAPLADARSRIVHTATQEWAYFGFSVLDLVPTRDSNPNYVRQPWRRTLIAPDEALRVATSIAGYWSSTPNSTWILERQNQSWDSRGPGSRWRNPWSAAFISWVMCESGLGQPEVFQRAIAHHSYIDQAIEAADSQDSTAAYRALNPGEQAILPGDMLCRGSRPAYRSIEARREQMGMGARSHCDIVVKLDPDNGRIMLIGGNVRSWVRLKLLPAEINEHGHLAPVPYNGRTIFAHLQLQAEAVSNDVLEQSPTLQSLSCESSTSSLRPIQETLFSDCS